MDAATYPRVGLKSFARTLPLEDREGGADLRRRTELLTDRLQIARKGIILLHDPKAQTAVMLPAFLRYLRDNSYRVVHVVPADAKTVSGKAH
ncbi:hypothetical protein [Bradyrhizobium icense]|uniref:Uncharacterized protein n=1 Tax=Bradyrhizobium icense TaxID=1274631 RepID=A0A1B1UG41_9BRAD|nr:hypothetical protein LMTR13_17650 [Bradyrhizobium icense]